MAVPDFLYLAMIVVLLLVDHFVLWPAFLRHSDEDPHRARQRLWSGWMIILWTLVVTGLGLWVSEQRSWESLRLTIPHGWRLWVAIGLVVAFAVIQARPILRLAGNKDQVRVKMGAPNLERLLPHTGTELHLWIGASLSAAVGEEFVFRGYLIWAFQPLLGLWGAAGLSVVAFALAHAYQGARGMLITGIGAILFVGVVLVLDSLWPAIVLHAILDVGHGLLGWLALRQALGADDALATNQARTGQ